MHYLQETLVILKKAEGPGCRTLQNGTRLIGRTPHVAPEAWFHVIFPPISDAEITTLENSIGIRFPEVFRDFLNLANGLMLFANNLSIYGLRNSFERTGDASWQPFSIITQNTIERPRDSKPHFLFIGGYRSGNGFYLYIDTATGKVYRCSRASAEPLSEWQSFEEMLLTETRRLSLLFDEAGRRIDPSVPIV